MEPIIEIRESELAILYKYTEGNLEYNVLCTPFGKVLDDFPILLRYMLGDPAYSKFIREVIEVVYHD